MKPITIEEIEYASRVLFNGDSTKFYDDIPARTGERVATIQCLENKTIVACPGSGKTTVLLAKLIILANRMPFDDGRGICVLTHTNVAIDLIKKKLGADASKLFAYPNFFGTTQSFVDKFLAIPYSAAKSEKRLRPFIDNDMYFAKIDSYRKYLGNPTNHFCIVNQKKGFPYSIKWDDFKIDENNTCQALKLDLNIANKESIYKRLKKMKSDINGDGVLSFEDAYFIANKYITAIPEIKNAFQQRFKFIFIDEMQDTASHQSKIINALFKGSAYSVVQEFGDPNQAIYDYDGQNGEWEYDEENCLYLTRSKRFGVQIAKVINPLRVKTNEPQIEGENQDSILPPHLIIFDKADKTVLDEFGRMIVEYGLHTIGDSKFVAIGRVGKENIKGEITLKTYWDGFEKVSAKKKEHFPTLIEYLAKDIPDRGNFAERIFNGILQLLERQDFKLEVIINGKSQKRRFTKTTLFDYLKKENEDVYFEFKTFISACGLKIKNAKENHSLEVYKQIVAFVNSKILPLKEIEPNTKIDFLEIPDKIKTQDQLERKTSIYEYKDGLGNIVPIKINTIHGEKGETHTATLFLETFKHGSFDSKLISKQLEGNHKIKNQNASKMAYVAMSRPKKLLCFAIQINRFETIKFPDFWTINKNLIL
ncbi:UvrD-helicase domain-containing protein [Draconibacterium orientale]|uniref:UvrD-helicase domain-containing protein n=1 Tax=Draconibacterium orientale TaxID=1168034 RepID=UPI0029C04A62|nr:UvrD-helicase domain-containing protein [Draconibacterium orientale]